MPKISVIVPVYKVEPYLCRCVDSILAQTFRDFEVILVDDGSPDNCGKICDEYAAKDARVVTIHQDNEGLSAARNVGVDWVFANSASEYITFIDSDDWVSEEYLEGLNAGCASGCAISCAIVVRSDGVSDRMFDVDICKECVSDYWVRGIQSVNAWGKLYPKNAFASIRFPVGKIHEDTYVVHRIIFAYQAVGVSSRSVYHYSIRSDSITGLGRTHCWTAKSVDAIEALDDQINISRSINLMTWPYALDNN